MSRFRFTIRQILIVVALLAVFLGFLIVPIGRQREWSRLNQEIFEIIGQMKPSNPASINLSVWECTHTKTTIAHMNVCYSSSAVSLGEMRRLREDLEEKRKGRIDLDTLVWICDRLAETGPDGKRYVKHSRPWFLQCFPAPANAPE